MKELTGENLGLIQARADGCVFFDLGDGRKSGRHVDDFLISGLHAVVKRQLDTMALTMDLRYVVRHRASCLVNMKIVKIDGGFTLRWLASHVDGMAREFGVEKSNPSETLAVNSETKESDDNELLSICQHRVC